MEPSAAPAAPPGITHPDSGSYATEASGSTTHAIIHLEKGGELCLNLHLDATHDEAICGTEPDQARWMWWGAILVRFQQPEDIRLLSHLIDTNAFKFVISIVDNVDGRTVLLSLSDTLGYRPWLIVPESHANQTPSLSHPQYHLGAPFALRKFIGHVFELFHVAFPTTLEAMFVCPAVTRLDHVLTVSADSTDPSVGCT